MGPERRVDELVDELLRWQGEPTLYSADLARREHALAAFRAAARSLVRHLMRRLDPTPAHKRCLKLDLIDSHSGDSTVLRDQLIGYVLKRGCVPVLVSCLSPGVWPNDAVCLNEVYTDRHGGHHLTTRAVLTLLPAQRAELHAEGQIRYDASTVVRLVRTV